MSYLQVPRLYFAGEFIADPSTVNNSPGNYRLGAEIPASAQGWNPAGSGAWGLSGCRITAVTAADGSYTKDPADDPVIGAPLTSVDTGQPSTARLVDLDPQQQQVSEIWSLTVELGGGAAGSFTSRFAPAAFVDLWSAGPGGQAGLRAWYQSVLTALEWGGTPDSPALAQLHEASPERLSMKFQVDRYNAHNPALPDGPPNFPDPGNGLAFTHGRVVGSIGPASEDEPRHFVAGRLLRPLGGRSPVHQAPCLHDAGRGVVALDLGNSLPAADLVDPVMQDLGTLELVLLNESGPPTLLGEIDYLASDWYPTTAGIVEIPVGAAGDQVESAPLVVVASGMVPKGIQDGAPLLVENLDGSFVRSDRFVFRLDPEDDSQSVDFWATRFGRPVEGRTVGLELQNRGGGVNTPASALPLGSTPATDAEGRASFGLHPQDPGTPRPFDLDGQLYFVDYALDGAEDRFPAGYFLSAHVYTQYPDVQQPTWWGDVHDILAQYHQLYPVMGFLPLDDYDTVKQNASRIRAAINRPLDDGSYMQVTRDLSRSKLAVINRWFDQGAPEGEPPS